MVMETPSPQCIGQEFVRQYYTILHEVPEQLHRFYSHDSCFVHGGVDKPGQATAHVQGQHDIHEKIMSLNFRDCYVKIGQVDSQPTVGSAVVVQVTGELSNNGEPMRRFMQTFVLVSQSPKKYYVHNDIFRYQDEVFSDGDTDTECTVEDVPAYRVAEVEQEDPVMLESPPVSAPASQPASSMYYESTPTQPPLTNGTTHLEEDLHSLPPPHAEPEHVHQASPPAPEPEEEEEEHVEVYEPPQPQQAPQQPEKSVEPESEPVPEQEPQAKAPSQPTNMTWAAMISRGGGSAPVSQPEPAVKAQPVAKPQPRAPAKPAVEGEGMGAPQPQRNQRPQRDQRPPNNRDQQREGQRPVDPSFMDDRRQQGPPLARFNDNQQVFVGNLPHNMSETDLKEYFERYGKVVDMRINKKNGNVQVPNYGFVVFEDANSVQDVLKNRGQFTLEDGHRINVEEKKQRNELNSRPGSGERGSRGGRGGPMMGGRGGRGGGMGDMGGWGNRGPGGPPGRGGGRGRGEEGGPPRGYGAPRR